MTEFSEWISGVIELAQEACFRRLTMLAIPRSIFFDLGSRVFEELEKHYRPARCK